ncbi:hypothetical protein [Chachezhania sediminis]|uniref:hypothetical protein n=1 Tax=Chachezhania sediminis TaxID=2599291 RepID=UPI00131BE095|nr:hypothetical protein [Chachezhania sediminis]
MPATGLRDAIAAQAGVARAQVIVGTGAKQVLADAMLPTLDRGNKVIMAAPYRTSQYDIVALAGWHGLRTSPGPMI